MIRQDLCRNCVSAFEYEAKGGKHRPLCERCEKDYKWCPPCEYALPLAAFGACSGTRVGLDAMCKRCRSERSKGRRQVRDPRLQRDHKLRARYGITLEEYERRMADQGGCCRICGRQRELVVDHCHSSGAVRGLLCAPCNKGLGHFEDDVTRLLVAADYLAGLVVQVGRTSG